MIDGSKSEPPFCVRLWLKKIEKKIVCRKVLLEKNCLQRCIDKKKFAESPAFKLAWVTREVREASQNSLQIQYLRRVG